MATPAKAVEPIAHLARLLGLTKTRFVIPAAPIQHVTYLRRKTESWFDVFERKPGRENEKELRRAAAAIAKLARDETVVHKVPQGKVAVVGMSQGGAVAITMFLAEEVRLAGLVLISTWLPLPTKWKKEELPAVNKKTPILMLHGGSDRVIPLSEAQTSAQQIRNLGRSVTFKSFAGEGHTLQGAIGSVAAELVRFFRSVLA